MQISLALGSLTYPEYNFPLLWNNQNTYKGPPATLLHQPQKE